jgi:hypothetical protein
MIYLLVTVKSGAIYGGVVDLDQDHFRESMGGISFGDGKTFPLFTDVDLKRMIHLNSLEVIAVKEVSEGAFSKWKKRVSKAERAFNTTVENMIKPVVSRTTPTPTVSSTVPTFVRKLIDNQNSKQ